MAKQQTAYDLQVEEAKQMNAMHEMLMDKYGLDDNMAHHLSHLELKVRSRVLINLKNMFTNKRLTPAQKYISKCYLIGEFYQTKWMSS